MLARQTWAEERAARLRVDAVAELERQIHEAEEPDLVTSVAEQKVFEGETYLTCVLGTAPYRILPAAGVVGLRPAFRCKTVSNWRAARFGVGRGLTFGGCIRWTTLNACNDCLWWRCGHGGGVRDNKEEAMEENAPSSSQPHKTAL